jgi:hypothetical protein
VYVPDCALYIGGIALLVNWRSLLTAWTSPAKYSSSASGYKNHSWCLFISLLLLCFFNTFFFLSIDIGTAPRTIRFLYNDLERRTQGNSLLVTILSTSLTVQTLTLINPLLFLSRSNGMATDIGFLAAVLDGHVVRLEIRRTHFFHVESVDIAFSNSTIP